MKRYCDTRQCTSVKTGTIMTSSKINNCRRWCHLSAVKPGDNTEFSCFYFGNFVSLWNCLSTSVEREGAGTDMSGEGMWL